MRAYYHTRFRNDLLNFMARQDVPYFGHSWHVDCDGLDRIPIERRADFLVCLYFTVLTDQTVHAHFRHLYNQFEALTQYPKFSHGLGQFQKNPRQILDIPMERGLISLEILTAALPSGMELFIDEVEDFSVHHMPEIKTKDFFDRLLHDADVEVPLLAVMVDPKLKESPGFRVYECLRNAVERRYGKEIK
jgi:hypothetical protein